MLRPHCQLKSARSAARATTAAWPDDGAWDVPLKRGLAATAAYYQRPCMMPRRPAAARAHAATGTACQVCASARHRFIRQRELASWWGRVPVWRKAGILTGGGRKLVRGNGLFRVLVLSPLFMSP